MRLAPGWVSTCDGAIVPAVNIGLLVPGSGTLVGNGLFGAGEGIDEQLYQNRGVHYAPRFGFAYDAGGAQQLVVRGGLASSTIAPRATRSTA